MNGVSKKKSILITGGAGFIGSHVVRRFVKQYTDYHIYNLDALTYAGNLENLRDIEASSNYTFVKGDEWYSDYREEQEAEKSKKYTEKIIKEFKQDKKQIMNSINEIDSLNIYKKNMSELKNNILNEMETLNRENEKIKNKKNINERISVYHTRSIEKDNNYEGWLKLFYWIFLSIYIIIILFIKRIYTRESLIKLLVLLLFPFIIEWIIYILNLFKFTKVKIQPNIEKDEKTTLELENQ